MTFFLTKNFVVSLTLAQLYTCSLYSQFWSPTYSIVFF